MAAGAYLLHLAQEASRLTNRFSVARVGLAATTLAAGALAGVFASAWLNRPEIKSGSGVLTVVGSIGAGTGCVTSTSDHLCGILIPEIGFGNADLRVGIPVEFKYIESSGITDGVTYSLIYVRPQAE